MHVRAPFLGRWGLLFAIMATALAFDPLKRAIQARVDRVFEQKRFDYRETLVDFGRGLNAQTDLRALVDSIVERAAADPAGDARRRLPGQRAGHRKRRPALSNSPHRTASPICRRWSLRTLDVEFLNFDRPGAHNHLFLENPQQMLRLPESQRRSAGRLDLNYYLPCRVANREGAGTRTVCRDRPGTHGRWRFPVQ